MCVDAGAPGITVHPRADARHITAADVHDDRARAASRLAGVEFNIEGDPRPDLLRPGPRGQPDQCTLVPVKPGEITSQAGWSPHTPRERCRGVVADLQQPASASACSSTPRSGRFAGPRRSAPTASSSTRSRSPGRSSEGEPTAARSFGVYASAAQLAHVARARRERRPRSRPRKSVAVPRAAAPGRGLDRPCAHQPCAVRRPRAQRPRIPGSPIGEIKSGFGLSALGFRPELLNPKAKTQSPKPRAQSLHESRLDHDIIAGMCFGVILGWLIGTQQARRSGRCAGCPGRGR